MQKCEDLTKTYCGRITAYKWCSFSRITVSTAIKFKFDVRRCIVIKCGPRQHIQCSTRPISGCMWTSRQVHDHASFITQLLSYIIDQT